MSKPIIGITTATANHPLSGAPFGRYVLNRDYVDRVIAAGGAPVMIPPGTETSEIALLLDGLLIPGGDDLEPSLWGDERHPNADLELTTRTETELALIKNAHPAMPILGICYGCQLINVMRGGTLNQHLPDTLGNDSHSGDTMQTYQVLPGSKLEKIVGTNVNGKSSHHQAVETLGAGLMQTATHEDGTLEALEGVDDGRWLIGVQWHPERTDAEGSEKLFTAFVQAAKAFKESKTSCDTW